MVADHQGGKHQGRMNSESGDFRKWPKCEVPTCASNVGSRENCGRDVLALSFTGCDPTRTEAAFKT